MAKRTDLAAVGCALAGLMSLLFICSVASAEMVQKTLRPAPGVQSIQLFKTKSLDEVVGIVDAKQLSGVFTVEASDPAAILVDFRGKEVWLDSFDVLLFDAGKGATNGDCIVLSKGVKSQQSSMGLGSDKCDPGN